MYEGEDDDLIESNLCESILTIEGSKKKIFYSNSYFWRLYFFFTSSALYSIIHDEIMHFSILWSSTPLGPCQDIQYYKRDKNCMAVHLWGVSVYLVTPCKLHFVKRFCWLFSQTKCSFGFVVLVITDCLSVHIR